MDYQRMNGMWGKIWIIGANGDSNWSYYNLKNTLEAFGRVEVP